MLRNSLFLLLCAAAVAQEQIKTTQELDSGSGLLDSGIKLIYKTAIEPPLRNSAFLPMGGAFRVSGDAMRHFIYDKAAQSYFGYEMTVLPGDDPKSRRVSFGPLALSEIRQAAHAVAGDLPLNAAPLPKYPPPQTVYDGDTIALDLMVSPDGRQRIVDYIQLVFHRNTAPPPAASAEPRDITLDDGPVAFAMGQADAFIGGTKFAGPVVMLAGRGGATLWSYFPGQGRYVLSLAPHDGFLKAGTVRAGSISFQMDGQEYEIRMEKPIAGTDQAWNLYVLRDSNYLPRSTLIRTVVISADRLENLLPRR